MKQKIELLAPGGDIDSIKAAISAGADAVYCGLNKFNARNRATNITFDVLQGILRLAHKNNCQVFLTLNILIVDSEIPDLINLLNKLINTSIDGVIVQDMGLFYLLTKYFKSLKIHASTQLTTHNKGQIQFLHKLGASRVNLSRELSINEIKTLTETGKKNNVLTEVFVHGSYCISFSGICYMSSVHGGNSGNRGRCSQPCRDRYKTTQAGKNFPLNLKDNSAYSDLKDLYDAGVYSFKIEGRIKEFEYVYTVVNTWKKQIESIDNKNGLINDNRDLYKVFNRDFTNSFLKGDINKEMFIDNPMSHSTKHFSGISNIETNNKTTKSQQELYDGKERSRAFIRNKIEQLSIEKAPVTIFVSGECGAPLNINIKTPESSFVANSEVNLTNTGTEALTSKMVLKRLKAINETEFYIKSMEFNIAGNLYVPFKELSALKKKVLFILNDSKDNYAPIAIPTFEKQPKVKIKPTLSVLISSPTDVHLCTHKSADIYYQLPNGFKSEYSELIELFKKNKKLIAWFPAILIGDNYSAAEKFLEEINPKLIVTNNTGIAFQAKEKGIDWIAGPHLNTVNSFSLSCLKEKFNCSGAFISNEINKLQIQRINKPHDFKLYYSIYHPIALMTSRVCLFHQVTGCKTNTVINSCTQMCSKSATITNLKNETFIIYKSKGNYHNIYNAANFLNTEIITDMPHLFSGFMIDLRNIKTKTIVKIDKLQMVTQFVKILDGNCDLQKGLNQTIHPTTNSQYIKGI